MRWVDNIKKKLRIDFDKNTKLIYYLKGIYRFILPKFLYTNDYGDIYEKLTNDEKKYIQKRVNYYNKLDHAFTLTETTGTIEAFISKEKKTVYYFDTLEYLKYFNYKRKFAYLFGDVISIPPTPSIVKSRPISDDNKNSILLNLDKVRHFIFVNDNIAFEDKKDILVWRGKVWQNHRKYFMNKFFDHPLCNIGQINKSEYWQKEKLSLREHLNYKFLLAIEGNDVASNLKWAMSSNSLVMMVKPKYETWFMEGSLIENYHYILLKDDYSDMISKMEYYIEHIDEAKAIIQNAHAYIKQFQTKKIENIVSVKVLEKYFDFVS